MDKNTFLAVVLSGAIMVIWYAVFPPPEPPTREYTNRVEQEDQTNIEERAQSKDIEDYFNKEVLTHIPDAWIDKTKNKVGYEIPFTRYFYVFSPQRTIQEIDSELNGVTSKILGMIKDLGR